MTIADALGLDDVKSMALSLYFFELIFTAPILVTLGLSKTLEFH